MATDFGDLGDVFIYFYDEDEYDSEEQVDQDISTFSNIYNLFQSRFTETERTHLTNMINQVKSEPFQEEHYTLSDELSELASALGLAIGSLN